MTPTEEIMETPTRTSTRSRWLELMPVAVVLLTGAVAIVLRAQQGPRGGVHIILLSAVLVENVLALLARGRHPFAALVGVLTTYVLVDNEATTLLPVVLSVFTVATAKRTRTIALPAVMAAVMVIATPLIHDDGGSLLVHTLVPLLAVGLAVAAGLNRRGSHRDSVTAGKRGSERPARSRGGSWSPAQGPAE